jgi:hypothetical protein
MEDRIKKIENTQEEILKLTTSILDSMTELFNFHAKQVETNVEKHRQIMESLLELTQK